MHRQEAEAELELRFEVGRPGRGPLVVLWRDGDLVEGERDEPAGMEWPWPHATVAAGDALGARPGVSLEAGRVRLTLSVTPVFLTTEDPARR